MRVQWPCTSIVCFHLASLLRVRRGDLKLTLQRPLAPDQFRKSKNRDSTRSRAESDEVMAAEYYSQPQHSLTRSLRSDDGVLDKTADTAEIDLLVMVS